MNETPNPDHNPANEQSPTELSQNEAHSRLPPDERLIHLAATRAEIAVAMQYLYQLSKKSPE